MTRWALVMLITAVWLTGVGPAAAFMTLEEYISRRVAAADDATARAELDAHIDGIASGLFTIAKDGQCRGAVFCQPENSLLTLDDFYRFVDDRIEKYRTAGIFEQVKDHSVSLTILFELRRQFPCSAEDQTDLGGPAFGP